MTKRPFVRFAILAATLVPTPAMADEVFGGVLVHDVHLPFDDSGFESGPELEVGYRGGRIAALHFLGRPSFYVRGALAASSGTDFASAGLSWRQGRGPLYFRPAAGIAVQTGRMPLFNQEGRRLDLGSRVVFELEAALGYRITRGVAVEAALVHRSHAGLFNPHHNPGMDSVGLRLNFNLP